MLSKTNIYTLFIKISAWFDLWCDYSPLINHNTYREISNTGFKVGYRVVDLIGLNGWQWPIEWLQKFNFIGQIPLPTLIEGMQDVLMWRDNDGREIEFLVSNAWNAIRVSSAQVTWKHVVWFS